MEIKYGKMEFVWISSHYDYHLSGLCRVDGELMRFETNYNYDEPICSCIAMTRKEKFKRIAQKILFEIFVSKSWTYKNGVRGKNITSRKPRLFWNIMASIYYSFKLRKFKYCKF